MANEILIGVPRIELVDGRCRLVADVRIPLCGGERGRALAMFLEVPREYCDYLTVERCDAFLIGLLHYALYHGLDVRCEAPISAELHWRLTETLIPALTARRLKGITIKAELAEGGRRKSELGAIGTGASCGVDSFSLIARHWNHPCENNRLTHLAINDVGAFRKGSGQFARAVENAKRAADELGLPLIPTRSNIAEVIDYPFELAHSYLNSFVVVALGKLYSRYYYSSSGYGLTHPHYSLNYAQSLKYDSYRYENLLFECLSAAGVDIVSEDGAKTRFEKSKSVANFEIASRYLNVCVADNGGNCGHCEKCRRQLLIFDALGVLDRFSRVFDLSAYRRDKWKYLGWALYRKWIRQGDMTNDALVALWRQIGFRSRAFAMARLMSRPFKGV